jgi:hypothetical protein
MRHAGNSPGGEIVCDRQSEASLPSRSDIVATALYGTLIVKNEFSSVRFSSLPTFSRFETHAKRGLHSWHGSLRCLAALSGQPPKPAGSRREARGVDGESACRATMGLAICFAGSPVKVHRFRAAVVFDVARSQ